MCTICLLLNRFFLTFLLSLPLCLQEGLGGSVLVIELWMGISSHLFHVLFPLSISYGVRVLQRSVVCRMGWVGGLIARCIPIVQCKIIEFHLAPFRQLTTASTGLVEFHIPFSCFPPLFNSLLDPPLPGNWALIMRVTEERKPT